MRKSLFIVLLFFILPVFLFGQNPQKEKDGIEISFGFFISKNIETEHPDADLQFSESSMPLLLQINYIYPFSKNIQLMAGFMHGNYFIKNNVEQEGSFIVTKGKYGYTHSFTLGVRTFLGEKNKNFFLDFGLHSMPFYNYGFFTAAGFCFNELFYPKPIVKLGFHYISSPLEEGGWYYKSLSFSLGFLF